MDFDEDRRHLRELLQSHKCYFEGAPPPEGWK